MSINSYLTNLADISLIRNQERENIQRSVVTLQTRLKLYFKSAISGQLIFGSYSRGTILPRSMDANSDVDYMIVFSDSSSKPQTYLDRLLKFVETYYSRSEIAQSNPTIVLSLNHIKFELVPAIDSFIWGMQIPAKASDSLDWITTDPSEFNQELTNANQSHKNLIKPLVRIIKYWNAQNNYPFESYQLEEQVVSNGFIFRGLLGGQLKDYFFDFIEDMEVDYFVPQWKQDSIGRAQRLAAEAKTSEGQGLSVKAEVIIKRLLPPVGLLAFRR